MTHPEFLDIALRPITDESAYENACEQIERLMDLGELADPTAEAERLAFLDALATLAEGWEKKNFAFNQIELPLPQVIEQASSNSI